MKQHCLAIPRVIHTYIYQTINQDPSNSDYQLENSTTGELYLPSDSTSITNQEVPVLSPTTVNLIGQLPCILTNNLNLKAAI